MLLLCYHQMNNRQGLSVYTYICYQNHLICATPFIYDKEGWAISVSLGEMKEIFNHINRVGIF